jgi:uncharacterized membrane protein YagU involved in acid resistance
MALKVPQHCAIVEGVLQVDGVPMTSWAARVSGVISRMKNEISDVEVPPREFPLARQNPPLR